MPEITICHLYPEHLNLYGDRGNILALIQRARRHGLTVNLIQLQPGDKINLRLCDIFFMGGGQDYEQKLVAEDFRERRHELQQAVDRGMVILAICGSYQLLGRYYATSSGERITGLGIIDLYTEAGKKRMIGNIITSCDLWSPPRTLVGFENHAGMTFLGPSVKPLGRVIKGFGNNGLDKTEGVVYRNVIGTYLHGALLPKNPWLTDYLLQQALSCRDHGYRLQPLEMTMETSAHQAAIQRINRRR